MPANLENSAVAMGLEKVSFHSNPKKCNAKECSNYHTITFMSHASKVMLKILQAWHQQYMNQELPDVQDGFWRGSRTSDQIANICCTMKNQRSSRKSSASASLTTLKPLTVYIKTNCGKFLKRWKYQTTLPASWETCMKVKKQQLELDMERWTGTTLGKEYNKDVYCHPAYLTYMQRISCEMPDWMKHSWNQDCWEKCQQPQISRWHHLYGRKWRGIKKTLDEGERGEWKSWLKTQH